MVTTTTTTREVLLHYIRHRLHSCGYDGSRLNCFRDLFIGLPADESTAMAEVECVGCQIESHSYHSAFLDMATQQLRLDGDCVRANYTKILTQIFCDRQINWGRLILVIVYTGRVAIKAMKADNAELVRDLADWCTVFFKENYLDQWVEANGGWDAIKGIYPTDWQRKEIITELNHITVGMGIMLGLIGTAFYILRRQA